MSPRPPPSELRAAVRAAQPYLLRAAGFSVLVAVLLLAPAGYMLAVYDRVINSRNLMTLAMLTLLVLATFGLMEVLEWVRNELTRAASLALDRQLGARVFQAMFTANLRHQPGGTVQAMNDLRTLREFVQAPVLMALMEVPAALVLLVLLFAISPVLGWSAVAGALLQTLLAWVTERRTQPPLAAANRAAIGAQQYADSTLRNAQVIESMGMLPDIHQRWRARQHEVMEWQAQASDAAGSLQALARLLQQVMGSLLLGLGAWLLLHDELHGGAGMMIVGSILGGRLLAPLLQAITQWRVVVQARDAWGRLELLLSQVPPPAQTMPLPTPRGTLSVENLVAGAPGSSTPIVRGLQFALAPGEVLAIVGPSAAGKTTLARLLVGLWPAAGGKVRLDGADVFAWNKAELGPHIGYLPQAVELFEGSVAENIARFGTVDRAQVEAAARRVGLHELILALPQGYDSPVGRDGALLSGGQRQRMALARALYGSPAFVVLDEPNSSLDEAGDAALTEAIRTLKATGTTFVVITHRSGVLAAADKMLVLRDGTQQLFGPRDEVLATLHQAAQQGAPGARSPGRPGATSPAAAGLPALREPQP